MTDPYDENPRYSWSYFHDLELDQKEWERKHPGDDESWLKSFLRPDELESLRRSKK